MKILIIGSGARECALAKKLHEEKTPHEIFFAPGSGATLDLGTNIAFESLEDLRQRAITLGIELSIVGSEEYLAAGVVDLFTKAGLGIFGASKESARLEYSKSFAKDFAKRWGIKTARFISTSDPREAYDFAEKLNFCVVVKADGLCGGKGAFVAKNSAQVKEAIDVLLIQKAFGAAGERVVVEEFLEGFELSVFALCDEKTNVLMPPCQDYKRLLEGEKGANTGGMGALCPVPVGEDLMHKIQTQIISPTLNGMKQEGKPFTGVLYCGLMISHGEPWLLEYNVRFGDPECQVLMPVLGSDLSALLMACAMGELESFKLEFNPLYALCVVAASADYPNGAGANASTNTGANAGGVGKTGAKKISVGALENKGGYLCFANVKKTAGELYTNGGRICSCVGLGSSLDLAAQNAYALMENVHFEGKQYRKDIGKQWIKTA